MYAMKVLLICFQMVHLGLCVCPSTVHEDVRGFKPGCKYRCNCRNNEQCDNNTGECPNGCLQGWMGPACQYRNIAASAVDTSLNPPQATATFSSRKSVDLDETTCSKTGPGQGRRWLRISLDKQFYLVGFVIKFPNNQPGILQRYSVEIGNSTDNWTLCFKNVEMSYLDTPIEVVCTEPVVGKYLRISLSETNIGDLNICELEIYGGRLVSFNRDTQIDSTLYYTNSYRNSSYGVDGKVGEVGIKEDYSTKRTCAATQPGGTAHWWNVDLSASFCIQGVSFFGRQDTNNSAQYRGFSVTYQRGDGFVEIFRDPFTSGNIFSAYKPMSINLTWPVNSRLVQVERKADILVLCELEVFADCPFGQCGWECEKTCMCSSQTTGAHKIVGTCPHGCAGRWTGEGIMCNTKCNDSHWGTDCTKKCGSCEDPCDIETGLCPTLCKPGWMPPDCTQVCSTSRFGQNCSDQCGNCKNDEACDHINGQCPAGCNPGFELEFCNKTCDKGMYGDNCSHTCGFCRNNASCEHVDGMCSDGCDSGYIGPLCKTACDRGMYGDNCFHSCGFCQNNASCEHVNGRCSDGCSAGYTGLLCKTTCDRGMYGDNCSHTCGFCRNNASCEHVDGTCSEGCNAGYTGLMCKTSCDRGMYGDNCLHPCGFCRNNASCEHVNGRCSDGCDSGYTGAECTTVCATNRFGQNCSGQCGKCKNGIVCDHITGQCPTGCEPGFKLEFCNETCDSGMYGDNYLHSCGYCRNNASCEHVDGRCSDGCDCGYTEPLCKTKMLQVISPGVLVAGILGGIVTGVLISIAAFVFVIPRIRRYKGKNNRSVPDESCSNQYESLEKQKQIRLAALYSTLSPAQQTDESTTEYYIKDADEVYLNLHLKTN